MGSLQLEVDSIDAAEDHGALRLDVTEPPSPAHAGTVLVLLSIDASIIKVLRLLHPFPSCFMLSGAPSPAMPVRQLASCSSQPEPVDCLPSGGPSIAHYAAAD